MMYNDGYIIQGGVQINTFKSVISLVTPWIFYIFPSYPRIFKVHYCHSILLRQYKWLTVSRFAAIDGVHAGSGLRWQGRSCGQIQQLSCFPILILNSTSAPFILFWRLHHLKGWRQPCLKIIWYGPRSLVSLSQMCVVCVAQFSTCLKLPVVDVALTKAQFKCNIAQRRWQCQMMSDLLSKINHRQTSLPGKLEN